MADFGSTKYNVSFEAWHELLMDYAELRGCLLYTSYPAGISLFRFSDTFFNGRHSPGIFCSSLT